MQTDGHTYPSEIPCFHLLSYNFLSPLKYQHRSQESRIKFQDNENCLKEHSRYTVVIFLPTISSRMYMLYFLRIILSSPLLICHVSQDIIHYTTFQAYFIKYRFMMYTSAYVVYVTLDTTFHNDKDHFTP